MTPSGKCQCLGVAHYQKWFDCDPAGQSFLTLRSFAEPLKIAREGLRGTFQPPRCESDIAAFELLVDVLSGAHVHPPGINVLCITCDPVVLTERVRSVLGTVKGCGNSVAFG